MKTTWNTRALYTRDGQRIAAQIEGNKVYFADLDRHVDGFFTVNKQFKTPFELEASVMHHYSFNDYQCSDPDDYVGYRRIVQELYQYAKEHAPSLRQNGL